MGMKECSGKKVLKVKVAQNDPLDSSRQNKHFEEFSEAAQVEIYRSASLQLNIVKLRLRFHSSK